MPANPRGGRAIRLNKPDDGRPPATIRGRRLKVLPAPGGGAPDELPSGVDDQLRRALANSGMESTLTSVVASRSESENHAVLAVTPRQDRRAVLLVHDEAGVVSWHRPHLPDDAEGAPAPGAPVEFRIPAHRLAPASAAPPLGRALAGPAVAGAAEADEAVKVLQVVEFPAGAAEDGSAALYAAWERQAHSPAVRWFPPRAGLDRGGVLTDAAWRSLNGESTTLLFIHGIFSSCLSGFAGLLESDVAALDELWDELRTEYGGRIIGYDHPTASVSPQDNVEAFLDMIPDGVHLTLDLVCHSRGGLVARLLAEAARAEHSKITVRKIVFAGTPNGGTVIVEPENWGALVDRWTNLLRFLPPGPPNVTNTLFEEILELVKLLADHGVQDLPGLVAMTPGSPLYADLDKTPNDGLTYYAIEADYRPHGSLRKLFDLGHDLGVLIDPAIDAIFADTPNDVAVPTVGVGDPGGIEGGHPVIAGFPVPQDHLLPFGPGEVWHCSYFAQEETWEHLRQWLLNDPPAP